MKRVTYIAPHKTALTCSLVLAIGSLVILVPMAVIFSFTPLTDAQGHSFHAAFPTINFLIFPIIYLVFGYIFTAIFAFIYNRIAKLTGGIIYAASEV